MNLSYSFIYGLIGGAIALYTLACVFGFLKKYFGAMLCFAGAWCLNLSVFVINWVAGGVPPFGNMFHVMIFLTLCFLPFSFFFKLKLKSDWLLPYFAVAASLFLIGTLFMSPDLNWQQMPALKSFWFVPHVASYIISYALNAVALILTLQAVIQKNIRHSPDHATLLADTSYEIAIFAFPFMNFGLLSGALWAEQAWGTYWSWDIKETWSLITWLGYIIYFHIHRTKKWKQWHTAVQIAAFAALLVTFFVVNFLPRFQGGLHTYGS